MDMEERIKFWREVYLAVIAGRGNSAAREAADEAVKDIVRRTEYEEKQEG